MAKNQKVGLEFEAKATGTGLKDTKKGLEDLGQAVDEAQFSISNLEKDVRSAEKKLKNTDLGAEGFEKLRIEIVKTKADLKKLKVGELDSKGIDALRTRVSRLKDKTRDAKVELSKPPKTSWANSVKNKFDELARAIPGGERLSGFFGAISKGSKGSVLAVGGLVTGFLTLGGIIRKGLGGIALFEDLEASFETLLGSASLAEQRLEEVREIAGSTPISVGDLATVSRQLETLTQGAFSGADALVLVGDAAAIAQKPGTTLGTTMQELAVHVGRLFASLKSGSGEIGESTNRLNEMGLISGGVKGRIRELHKEVGGGEEAWRLLQDALLKFEGEMLRRSDTISGATNNLGDAWDKFTRLVAKPISPIYKISLQALGAVLNSLTSQAEETLDKILVFFGVTGKEAKKLDADVEKVIKNAKSGFQSVEEAAKSGAENAAASVELLTGELEDAVRKTKDLASQQNKLADLDLQIEFAEIEAKNLSEVDELKAKKVARDENRARKEQIEKERRDAEKAAIQKPVIDIKKNEADTERSLLGAQIRRKQLTTRESIQSRREEQEVLRRELERMDQLRDENPVRMHLGESVFKSDVRQQRIALVPQQERVAAARSVVEESQKEVEENKQTIEKLKGELKELRKLLVDRKKEEEQKLSEVVFSNDQSDEITAKKDQLSEIQQATRERQAERKQAIDKQNEANDKTRKENKEKQDKQKKINDATQKRISDKNEGLISLLEKVLPADSDDLIESAVSSTNEDSFIKSFKPVIGKIKTDVGGQRITTEQVKRIFNDLLQERESLSEGEKRLEKIEKTIQRNSDIKLDSTGTGQPEAFSQVPSPTVASNEGLTETIKQGGSDTTAALQQTQLAMQNSNARVVAVITGMTAAQADLASTLQELSTKVNSNIAQVSQIKSQVENNRRTA